MGSASLRFFRAFRLPTFALLLAACGSRTPLTVGSSPSADAGTRATEADAEVVPPDPVPPSPRPAVPPAWYCFGDVSTTHNVSCRVSRGAPGLTCDATMVCNGDHVLTASCTDGHCTCDNPGFNTCYCDVDRQNDDACGEANCCWR